MKKMKYFIFSIICLFSCSIVFAENEVTIKSVTPIYDEESELIVSNDNNTNSVIFNDIDQTIKYNIVIENTSGYELTVEEVNLSKPSQDFIIYELDGLKKDDVLKSEETKELVVTVKTIELNNLGADFNESILATIDFEKSVINPFTSTKGLLALLVIATGVTFTCIMAYKQNKAAKYMAILLVGFIILPVVNAKDEVTLDLKINVNYKPSSLKILSIGNSFSADSQEYLYQIAEDLGYKNITLGNLYIGGCSLEKHLSNAKSDSASYTYYTNTNGEWKSTNSYKISTAVKSEDWHYITFQQASTNSGQADTYDDLKELIEIVKPMSENSKLVWHMTWAYQQSSTHSGFANYSNNQIMMYDAIIDAVQSKIKTNNNIDIILPVGTAVQNARTSTLGDNLTRDGYHMSYNEGRYIAGVAFLKGLLNTNVNNLTYKPNGVSDEVRKIAIESANNAYAKPFTITQSEYTSMKGYKRVELDLTKNAYYATLATYPQPPTLTTPENKTDVTNHKFYWATQAFSKDDLPVGTIIKIASNWQYRPDAWNQDNYENHTSSTRPANVTTNQIVIDEAWWGNYTHRGFNIAIKGSAIDITGLTEDQINSVFQIYVPIEVTEEDKEEPKEEIERVALELTKASFYNSQSHTNAQPPLLTDETNNTNNNHPFFWATQVFTKETLPVGSKIVVAEGWQYRPEGWTIDSNGNYTGNTSSTRPANVTTTEVIIDEAWWGNYTHRGFNIAKVGATTDLSGYTESQINAVFQIYIPTK